MTNLVKLSDQQQKAVNHSNSSVLISAGAGAGKTRTLIAKFIQLIETGLSTKRILAITFTNKAANEMKNRLIDSIKINPINLPWIKTYHSACLNILKDNCELLGLNECIQIYTKYHQEKIIKKLLLRFNINAKFTKSILNTISNAKNTNNPEKYLSSKKNLSNIPILNIYKLYQKYLFEKNALDFDNILILIKKLFRNSEEIRSAYRKFFQYILCDEYQDTNDLNEEITNLLINDNNFFAVGDDWQSIYSFRMSNIDHFFSFHSKYPKSQIFKLEENYRSSDSIVQLGNRLISFNKNQVFKECFSKKKGGIIKIVKLKNDIQEVGWITKKIKTIHSLGMPLENMSILYRTRACSFLFEQILRRKHISYNIIGGRSFFDKAEVIDLISYLSSAVFDQDNTSFKRIINIPKRGIGLKTLEKISNLYSSNTSLKNSASKIINQKFLSKKINNSLEKLLGLLNKIRKMKPACAIKKIIKNTNYINYIKNHDKLNPSKVSLKLENVEQLIFSASQQKNILNFLEEVNLTEESKEKKEKGVNLATIHKAKGLEFDLVFISGCEEQLIPHWKSISNNKNLDEERRLMYVAITRAKRYLFITYTSFRKGQHVIKSRFLDEF